MYDGGRMDGAGDIPCSGTCATTPQFKFVDNSTGILDPYLELATQYGWANYMFQTNQGPSFPAHQFVFGGTSAPNAADDAAGIFAASGRRRMQSSTSANQMLPEVVTARARIGWTTSISSRQMC